MNCMSILKIFFLAGVLWFFSCNIKPEGNTKALTGEVFQADSPLLQTFDTSIVLPNKGRSGYKGPVLTSALAQKFLYAHFESRAYFRADKLPGIGDLKDSDSLKLCVDFDTLYLADLNHNAYPDGIITYWLTPPYGSSTCYLPHKAMILDGDKGYQILQEDFIPASYGVDSLVEKDNHITIYVHQFDCGKQEIVRNIRIKLN